MTKPYGTIPNNKQLSGLIFELLDLSFALCKKNLKLDLDKTILKLRYMILLIS